MKIMRKGENLFNETTKLISLSSGTMNLKIMKFFWNVFQCKQRLYYILKIINNVTTSN